MFTRVSIVVAAAFLATVATSYAQTTINGSYTAVPTGTELNGASAPSYAPLINDDGGSFQSSPFSENLSVGTTVGPSTFIQVAPIAGGAIGTVTGSIAVALTFTAPGGSTVTGLSYTSGANSATLSNGVVNVSANYELFYSSTPSQTDCLTWTGTTCTADDITGVISDTLVLTFADGAVLDVNMYNWSDWNMAPNISYKLVKAPTAVPEPASLAIFATAIGGLGLMRRRSLRARKVDALSS